VLLRSAGVGQTYEQQKKRGFPVKKKKKKAPIQGSAKGTFPVGAQLPAEKMIPIITNHLASVEACPAYVNQQEVQSAATKLKGSLGSLAGVLTSLSTARTLVVTLEGERDAQSLAVRRDHAVLETSVNNVSQGQPNNLVAWGAKLSKRSALAPSTDAPVNVAGKALGSGMAQGQCKADPSAKCYLFQVGTDPTNPNAWPPAVIVNGCRYKFEGTVGQKLYFRVAVQRRKVGLGQWSDLVEVMVH
jgi:hypothetical protein